MQALLIVLLVSFFIFLFYIYVVGREDVVFIRKNISAEQLFNIAIASGIFGLLTARITYIAFHPAHSYFNPLVFLLFPYFPGLSFIGGVIGGCIYIYYTTKRRKLPTERLLDYFSLAFLCALPFGTIILFIFDKKHILIDLIIGIVYIILFILFTKLLLKMQYRGNIKEGSIASIFLFCFSLLSLLQSAQNVHENLFLFFGKEDFLTLILLLFSLFLIMKQELWRRAKRLNR